MLNLIKSTVKETVFVCEFRIALSVFFVAGGDVRRNERYNVTIFALYLGLGVAYQ